MVLYSCHVELMHDIPIAFSLPRCSLYSNVSCEGEYVLNSEAGIRLSVAELGRDTGSGVVGETSQSSSSSPSSWCSLQLSEFYTSFSRLCLLFWGAFLFIIESSHCCARLRSNRLKTANMLGRMSRSFPMPDSIFRPRIVEQSNVVPNSMLGVHLLVGV